MCIAIIYAHTSLIPSKEQSTGNYNLDFGVWMFGGYGHTIKPLPFICWIFVSNFTLRWHSHICSAGSIARPVWSLNPWPPTAEQWQPDQTLSPIKQKCFLFLINRAKIQSFSGRATHTLYILSLWGFLHTQLLKSGDCNGDGTQFDVLSRIWGSQKWRCKSGERGFHTVLSVARLSELPLMQVQYINGKSIHYLSVLSATAIPH